MMETSSALSTSQLLQLESNSFILVTPAKGIILIMPCNIYNKFTYWESGEVTVYSYNCKPK